MVDQRCNPLSGLVEIDETSLHHRTRKDPAARGQGRSHDGKLLIAGVVEIVGQGPLSGPSRVRHTAIDDFFARRLPREWTIWRDTITDDFRIISHQVLWVLG